MATYKQTQEAWDKMNNPLFDVLGPKQVTTDSTLDIDGNARNGGVGNQETQLSFSEIENPDLTRKRFSSQAKILSEGTKEFNPEKKIKGQEKAVKKAVLDVSKEKIKDAKSKQEFMESTIYPQEFKNIPAFKNSPIGKIGGGESDVYREWLRSKGYLSSTEQEFGRK